MAWTKHQLPSPTPIPQLDPEATDPDPPDDPGPVCPEDPGPAGPDDPKSVEPEDPGPKHECPKFVGVCICILYTFIFM